MTRDHTAEIVEVIRTTFHRGNGTVESPHRVVVAYHTTDGVLLVEQDPCEGYRG